MMRYVATQTEVGHVLATEADPRTLLELANVTRRKPCGLARQLVEVVGVALCVHVLDPDLLLRRHPSVRLLPRGFAGHVVVVVVTSVVITAQLPTAQLHLLERRPRRILRVPSLLCGHLRLEHASLLGLLCQYLELTGIEFKHEHLPLKVLPPPELQLSDVEVAVVVQALCFDGHKPNPEAFLELPPVSRRRYIC